MSYDGGSSRRTITLSFPAHDFGTGSDITQVIQLPTVPSRESGDTQKFNGGRIVGAILHSCTEDFAGSTSDAGVSVGDGSDPDLYYDSGLVLDETVDATESLFLPDDGAAVDIPSGASSVGSLTVTFTASVGTPTGIATIELIVDLF